MGRFGPGGLAGDGAPVGLGREFCETHPSRRNKGPARVGHTDFFGMTDLFGLCWSCMRWSFMRLFRGLALSVLVGTMIVPVRIALAADDLNSALRRLDVAAAKFKSAEAEIAWDNVQTQPIPDDDIQLGSAIFQRKGGQLSVALRLKTENGRPVNKEIVYTEGALKFYEPLQKRMTVYKAGDNRAEFESLLTLGFGASGKDLEKNWAITLGGTESMGGVAATRLELLPREESLKKNVAKVILWVDLDRGVALKQRFDDPSGNYREVTYKNLKLNGGVPGDAFEIKTAPGTTVQNH